MLRAAGAAVEHRGVLKHAEQRRTGRDGMRAGVRGPVEAHDADLCRRKIEYALQGVERVTWCETANTVACQPVPAIR